MSPYGCQSRVGAQLVEVVRTVSAHAVSHHEALHERGFIGTAVPLPDVDVARHALRYAE